MAQHRALAKAGVPREVLEAELHRVPSRMGRRPLDRRSFRDGCAAERSQMWRPENVPQDIHFGDLIVRWQAYSCHRVLRSLHLRNFTV